MRILMLMASFGHQVVCEETRSQCELKDRGY